MLDSCLPQSLSQTVIGQLEPDGTLELFELARTDLDVEVIPLVGDLEDLGPREAVDSEAVAVDEEPWGTDADHDVDALGVLGLMQVNSVHGQLLGILQVMQLGFSWRLASDDRTYNTVKSQYLRVNLLKKN